MRAMEKRAMQELRLWRDAKGEGMNHEALFKKAIEARKNAYAPYSKYMVGACILTEDGQVTFDFPEKPKPVETSVTCPKCQKKLMKAQWNYECECGFKVSHTVAKVELSEEVMKELLETGKTKDKPKPTCKAEK